MKWRTIKGYEGLYEVSEDGNIRSVDRIVKTDIRHVKSRVIKGKVLAQGTKRTGYRTVDLCKNGKVTTTLVHRIVAETFLPNPENLRFVNHKDSDRTNNAVNNLEWVTSSENRRHGIEHGFVTFRTNGAVECVETGLVFERPLCAVEWVCKNYPGRVNGKLRVAAHNISEACKNKKKSAYGFTWKYHEGSTTIPKGSRGKRPEMGDSLKKDEEIV